MEEYGPSVARNSVVLPYFGAPEDRPESSGYSRLGPPEDQPKGSGARKTAFKA